MCSSRSRTTKRSGAVDQRHARISNRIEICLAFRKLICSRWERLRVLVAARSPIRSHRSYFLMNSALNLASIVSSRAHTCDEGAADEVEDDG